MYIGTEWTEKEVLILKKEYPIKGPTILASQLQRSVLSVVGKARRLGLKCPKNNFLPYQKDELVKATKDSKSFSDVLRKCNKQITGPSMAILKKYLKLYEIDTSCLVHAWESNIKRARHINEYLKYGSHIGSSKLKKKLYQYGLKEEKCEECGQPPEWNGKKLTLQLDHVNGDNKDNRIENLSILCPNCHTQTKTYSMGNSKLLRKKNKEIEQIKREKEVQLQKSRRGGFSLKEIKKHESNRKVVRPEYSSLIADIDKIGYLGVGRKYGVSDNAIRKWVKYYQKTNTAT